MVTALLEDCMKMVSVIVPIYNAACYLESCIDSIINNTYRNLQIILVDDGSTDSSAAICDKFAASDSRIVVIHQRNSGLVAARNAGIGAASGDYISFVDADDQIAPEFYAKMVAAIESKDADIAACEYRNKLEDISLNQSSKLCNSAVLQTFEEQLSVLTCAPSIRSITWTGPYVWNKLYKSDRITELFKKECLMCEDLRFNYDYIKSSNKMVVVMEGLYFYRLHDGSITGVYRKKKSSSANGVANAKLWAYIAQNAEGIRKTLHNYLQARAAYTAHGALWRVYLFGEEEIYSDFVKEAKRTIYAASSLLCHDRETYGVHVRCAVWSCAHVFVIWKMIVKCSSLLSR